MFTSPMIAFFFRKPAAWYTASEMFFLSKSSKDVCNSNTKYWWKGKGNQFDGSHGIATNLIERRAV